MRKVVFRADAGTDIGYGHFIRSLALVDMIKADFECVFVTQSPTEYQRNEVEKVCKLVELPHDDTKFQLFLDYLKGDEIVVLDNYYFDTEYQKAIKTIGCKLVCIDDLHNRHFVADAVINHAEGIKPDLYSKEGYTKLLLGYKYALLRKEFLNESFNSQSKVFSCIVIMGGADPYNLSNKIISLLKDYSFLLPIAVVVGAGFTQEHLFEKYHNIKLFKGISSSCIFQLMLQSEFGILPASTVAIEACAARLPFVCGYFVDNQKEIYLGIKSNQLAICVDDFFKLESKILCNAIDIVSSPEMIINITHNQTELLDKKSKERFINCFTSI